MKNQRADLSNGSAFFMPKIDTTLKPSEIVVWDESHWPKSEENRPTATCVCGSMVEQLVEHLQFLLSFCPKIVNQFLNVWSLGGRSVQTSIDILQFAFEPSPTPQKPPFPKSQSILVGVHGIS